MAWRTVIITETCKLDYSMGNLTVRSNGEIKRIHLSEIITLIVESTAVSLTAYLLVELANLKINVIFCDRKRIPHGCYLPFAGCHNSSAQIRQQVRWEKDDMDIIWQSIVARKIEGQATVLRKAGMTNEAMKLKSYIADILPGDPTNREGPAAKVYFNALFGKDFTREDETNVINAMLNYAYSILLSLMSREVVNNGHLTQLGIHHDNIFNSLNLPCDLMEPFRPFIDYVVFRKKGLVKNFGTEEKHELTKILELLIKIDDREQFFPNAVAIYCKSIIDAIDNGLFTAIKFPEYELSLYESTCDV